MMKAWNRFLLLSLMSLLALSCRKEVTSWKSNWILPLFQDSLNLSRLVNDTTLAVQDGAYLLQLERTLATIRPGEYLDFPDTTIYKTFTIPVSSLSLPAGTSFVTDNDDHVFDLDDVLLKKARLKSGIVSLTVENPLTTTSYFEVILPGTTLDGVSLSRELSVGPKGTSSIQIDLSGYELDLRGSSGIDFNALSSKLKVFSDPSGPNVQLSNTDTTKVAITLEDMEVDYGQGYFGQYEASGSYDLELDYLKDHVNGKLDLPNFSLDFVLSNSIKAMARARLSNVASVNTSLSYTVPLASNQLNQDFIIQNATGSWGTLTPSETSLSFNQNNSNIESFVENLGDRISLAYEVQLNPYGNISGGWDEFFPESKLEVVTRINMPLMIGLDNFSIRDTFDVDLSQDLSSSHVEQGTLHFKIENAFPISGDLHLFLLDDYGQVLFDFDDLDIPSAKGGALTNLGINSLKKQLDIPILEQDLEKLNQVKRMVFEVKFNTPDETLSFNEMVVIPERAFFLVKAQASFRLKQVLGSE
ncbi:MAG: hypothetical protein EP338_01800 [Bacteroidetes bacterium]|nr:MAG: hypothetical protein EP338_01800 [Bacteroidota bacterium]